MYTGIYVYIYICIYVYMYISAQIIATSPDVTVKLDLSC